VTTAVAPTSSASTGARVMPTGDAIIVSGAGARHNNETEFGVVRAGINFKF